MPFGVSAATTASCLTTSNWHDAAVWCNGIDPLVLLLCDNHQSNKNKNKNRIVYAKGVVRLQGRQQVDSEHPPTTLKAAIIQSLKVLQLFIIIGTHHVPSTLTGAIPV